MAGFYKKGRAAGFYKNAFGSFVDFCPAIQNSKILLIQQAKPRFQHFYSLHFHLCESKKKEK